MTALLLTGLQPAIVVGAHHYVRSAASGSNTGTDWNNAWTNTSAIMWGRIAAGDSVWIAGGNYTTLAPSVSGATNAAIYIARVRTTNTTPAAAAGWNSSYDSLVTIASLSPVTINSVDWITLDGQIPHSGILITNTAATNDSLSRYAVNISGGADYFTLKNTKIRLCNRAYNVGSSTYDRRCVNVSYSKANIAYGMYIGYNDLAHGDTLFSILYQTAMTVEHNWFHDNNREAVIGPHQNIWQSVGNTNITFRYNLITNYQQECIMMCFVSSSDAPNDTWYIYGNLFANGTEYSRVLESQYRAQYRIYFFNNTIANTGFLAIRGSGTANGGTWDPSCVSSNNVLFNSGASSGVGFGVGGDNYNITDGTTSGANSISGAVSSMFVNNNGRDYHIGSVVSAAHPKDKGVALAAIAGHTLNVDMDGNTRGADGVWDIGAYEYSSSTNLPPPDTAAPQVELTSPASGATVGGTLNLNATASDNEGGSGVASVVFLMDGNVVGTATISPYSIAWSSATVSNGGHMVQARAQDYAGNQATSASVSFTVLNQADTTPPSVAVTAPLAAAVVSNSVTLAASASDGVGGSGITSVTFFADGIVIGTLTTSPYALPLNSLLVANGPHTIQAKAVDGAGNEALSAIVSITVSNATALPPAITDGLVGWWRFEETTGITAADSGGRTNHGTRVLSGAWGRGLMGACLTLDGTNGYVRVPSSPGLELVTNAVTISAWILVNSNGPMQTIARKVLSESTNLYPYSTYDLVLLDTGSGFMPRMGVARTDSTRGVAYGTAHSYGGWYHLAGSYDGAVVRLYVNGVEEGSAPFAGLLLQSTQPLCIGRYGTVSEAVKGQIDDFRLYNRALSLTDIQTLSRQPAAVSDVRLAVP